ncbi:MAG: hypothetical protein PHE27_05815 [Alphaproteobacteria bacterium]|nr:hypothetical protein [Alphaproteobacteria bacterium]
MSFNGREFKDIVHRAAHAVNSAVVFVSSPLFVPIVALEIVQHKVFGAYDFRLDGAKVDHPNRLVLYGDDHAQYIMRIPEKALYAGSKIWVAPKNASLNDFVDALEERAKTDGPFDEVVFSLHGEADTMFSGDSEIGVGELLSAVGERQKGKPPFARRYVFAACLVFSNSLTFPLYQKAADDLGVEIAGGTNCLFSGPFLDTGRWVKFSKNNPVSRDRLDMPVDIVAFPFRIGMAITECADLLLDKVCDTGDALAAKIRRPRFGFRNKPKPPQR